MSTATFDPLTATVVVNSAQGVTTWRPPFTSQDQITSYAEGLQNVATLKSKGMIKILVPLTPTSETSSISTELPAVQVYNIPNNNPPIFAVVYTDSNGASNFSYKNDPNNRIRLVQNGSRIDPLVSAASPTGTVQQTSVDTVKQTYATSSTQESSGGGILGAICWCLSCMSSIGFVCFIGFIVYMALKKQP